MTLQEKLGALLASFNGSYRIPANRPAITANKRWRMQWKGNSSGTAVLPSFVADENAVKFWTLTPADGTTNYTVTNGEVLGVAPTDAGTLNLVNTSLTAGDVVRIKVVGADDNNLTLDCTTGGFLTDSTTSADATLSLTSARHDLTLFWDGANFWVF